MARQKRSPDPDLTSLAGLQQDPGAYHLFQALRLFEAAHPDGPRLGQSRRPSEDPVRLGQPPEMAFAPATISAYERTPDGPDRLSQQAFGLFGPQGPLPLHMTEYARTRSHNHNDPTLAAFADIFHHRMISLFYRAWASSQPTVGFDRPEGNRFDGQVAALAGLAGEAFEHRDAMPDLAKRHFAGHLANDARSAANLQSMLEAFFDTTVSIDTFVGSWLALEPHDQGRLGQAALGQDASLGEKVWSREAKFRVRIGPLGLDDYLRLLPGTPGQKRLAAVIRNYVGDTLDWDVNLILKSEDVPASVLGQSSALGQTSWIGTRSDTPADDLYVPSPAFDTEMPVPV